ncbi:Hsp20/alpha crystallin family protein [Planctomicrobium sp. SH661]|uniref:Hsp20/alpha crystallin family protein n=1 Tax=Planctomicrobium sp. SH661 TaxID=3448124 RepID=UPI003F5C749A
MRAANRVQGLMSASPFSHFNSLLMQELGRYCMSSDAHVMRRENHRVWAGEDFVIFEVDLPGHALEDLDVSLEKDIVKVAVKPVESTSKEGTEIHLNERQALAGELQMRLPFQADPEQIETTYSRGVLKIVVQRPERELPRQLEIKPGE